MKRLSVWLLCGCLLLSMTACARSHPDLEESQVPGGDVSTTTTAADTDGSDTVADDTTTTTEDTTTTTATPTAGRTTGGGNYGGHDCIGVPTSGTTQGLLCDGGLTTTKTTTTTTTKPTTTTTQEKTVDLAQYALAQSHEIVNKKLIYDGYTDGMSGYYGRVLPVFLQGDTGENRVCSPLTTYLALAMLAETAAGNSRQQILDLLGEQDTETLVEKIPALWNSVYSKKNGAQCLLANSIWLDQSCSGMYSPETAERLAFSYYASVFRGEMGTKEYDSVLREWLNQNTGGLLKEQAGEESFPPNGVFSLVSTIYFNVEWEKAFSEQQTYEGLFNTKSHSDPVKCDFMTDTTKNTYYWEAEEFTAINRPMNGNYSMWYILPDENVGVDALLQNADVLGMVTGTGGGAERINCDLVTKVPKFDVTYKKDLAADIQSLGVTDLFSIDTADLSTVLGSESVGAAAVDGVSHAVRVLTKEKGVEAAAYTGITVIMKGTATTTARSLPLIHFTADRPFMFAITSSDGSILFAGVIENPTLK